MADNYVSIRIKADDSAKPDLTELKAKLDELGHTVETARAEVNDKQADAALARLSARLSEIGRRVENPRIKMAGADKALADLLAVDVAMDRLQAKADAASAGGGLLSRLFGGGGGSGGGAAGASGILSNPYAAGGIFAGLIAAAPFAGQLAAEGLVGGLGTGLAGIGVYAAMKAKPVEDAFKKLKTNVGQDLQDIGKPFQGTLQNIFTTASGVFQSLTPVFAGAEKMISGPLGQFADTFLKSFNQPEVKNSILAIGNAFSSLLKAITPQLPNDFRMIANAITAIANNIAANPQAFSAFINALVKITVYALNVINALTATANFIERDFLPAMLTVAQGVIKAWGVILDARQVLVDGILSAFGTILHGAATAFGWIPGIGSKLKGASKAFDDFKTSVDANFAAATAKVNNWNTTIQNMKTKIAIKGDITDLQNKLNSARNQLDDPGLTKTRRAQIQANIAQLQQQIQYANDLLNFINGRTATTYVITQDIRAGAVAGAGHPVKPMAHGGIVGAASGGIRGSLTMVGEHGPELVRLPSGSNVYSNPDTGRMLGAGGGGGASRIEVVLTMQGTLLKLLQATVREAGGDPAMFQKKVAYR